MRLVLCLVVPAFCACGFEVSGSGSGTDDQPPEAEDLPPGGQYFARADETPRGEVLEGTLADARAADGRSQVIGGEIDRNDEKLEHRWYFDELPAGAYQIELVASFTGLQDLVSLPFELSTELEKGRIELFALPLAADLVTYQGTFVLSEPSELDFRIKLPGGVRAASGVAQSVLRVDLLVAVAL